MAPSSNGDTRGSSLRAAIADAEKALEWLNDPRYSPIEERFKSIVKPYRESALDVNVTDVDRNRAVYALDVGMKFLNIRTFYEKKLTHARAELMKFEQPNLPKRAFERVTAFMR